MRKPVIGDIFEIETPKGLGYLQYVRFDERLGELIRVLQPLLPERPLQYNDLVLQPERFFTFFPLAAANSKRIVEWVANEPVLGHLRTTPAMRSPLRIDPQRRVVESWWIIDGENQIIVETLTDEQKRLSIEAVINDTLLIDRLVNDWRPVDYT
jgi:hypothetical protein